ncbi:putative unusual protein kinase [Chamaesiphon minutus PCC 6605]|uniref:Putative unusual protein kinase n=2 Tax=Chamaesiphon TaxID=217161 RepID=K9UBN8_CHAP6|nr:putative unusual protein kinase [Chamaesiphon minutus PCC 6605]
MTAISEPCLSPSGDATERLIEPNGVEASARLSLPPEANVSELSAISMPQIVTDPQMSNDNRAYRWNRTNYSKRRRTIDIWSFFLTFLSSSWIDGKKWSYINGYTEAKQAARRRKQAIWIRDTFLELGPTFIKLGQLFSTRADLFPVEYVEELSKLQDRVPAFSYAQVEEIIERDLGKKIPELFAYFDPTPLAAASLGQVHLARLYTGEDVVVKVQRPGLNKLFTIDLEILRGIAKYFQNHPKWGGGGRDWLGIYDECCRILWEETDYISEGQNADTFRRNFRSQDWVMVPRVYWRYSSTRTLTLEYLPGIKISSYEGLEAAGLDRQTIARQSATAYLQQLLTDGFFHADPHPGNVAIDPKTGALIFYDFGMMGRIAPGTKEKLMDTLLAIAGRNADRVVRGLVGLGAIAAEADTDPIRRSVQYLLDNFLDKPIESQSIAQITDDLYDIAYGQPFRFPATFTFVMRAFSTIEGVGKGLDPDFNFMEAAQPFAFQIMNTNGNSNPDANTFLAEIGRQAAQVGTSALGLPRRLEDTIDKLERGDIRVRVRSSETDRYLRRLGTMQQNTNYAILVAAFTLSATILFVNAQAIPAGVVGTMAAIALVAWFRQMRKLDRQDRMS